MPRRLARSLLVALPLTSGVVGWVAGPAVAHETRTGGALRFVVCWGDEPAYTGFKNSVQVTISEANGGPVTDAADALKVEVTKGDDTMTAPLVPNFRVGAFGTPGDYRAWITPTRPGSYTFKITGTLRGQNVNETFTSSRTTFNDVEDVSSIQFPAKDPTTGQLATRVDRELPRLDTAVQDAEDQAGSARTLALAGVAVGLLGLLAGAGALVMSRRGRGGTGGAGPGRGATRAEQPESLSR